MISNRFKGDIMTNIIVTKFQLSTVFSVSVVKINYPDHGGAPLG